MVNVLDEGDNSNGSPPTSCALGVLFVCC